MPYPPTLTSRLRARELVGKYEHFLPWHHDERSIRVPLSSRNATKPIFPNSKSRAFKTFQDIRIALTLFLIAYRASSQSVEYVMLGSSFSESDAIEHGYISPIFVL